MKSKKNLKAKVLILDIETSYCTMAVFKPGYNLNITPNQILEESKIIMISYKWLGDKKVNRLVWDKKQCDKKLLKEFSKVYNEADLAVAHNLMRFDLPWINARLIYHSLPPLQEIPVEDTLQICRRKFRFNSNKLDYVGQYLKVGQKLAHQGLQLWIDVVTNNDKKALAHMGKYCDQDVLLLERVYKKLLPYYTPRIDVLGVSALSCLRCATKMTTNGKYKLASGGEKRKLRCLNCGSCRTIPETKYLKERG